MLTILGRYKFDNGNSIGIKGELYGKHFRAIGLRGLAINLASTHQAENSRDTSEANWHQQFLEVGENKQLYQLHFEFSQKKNDGFCVLAKFKT